MQETKKAFRNIFKREDLQSGLTAMCNLKGVGPAMASGRAQSSKRLAAAMAVSTQNGEWSMYVGGHREHGGQLV